MGFGARQFAEQKRFRLGAGFRPPSQVPYFVCIFVSILRTNALKENVRTPTASVAPSSRAASPSAPSVTFPAPPDPSPRIQSPSPERPPPPFPASRSPSPAASQIFPPMPQSVPPVPQLPRTESSSLSPAVGAPRVSVQSPPPPKAPQVAPQVAPQPTRSVSSPTPRAPQSNQAPRLPLPARTLEVPEEGRAATNSLPFMPHDLHSRSASTAPLGAAPGPAHPSDRWCLPCEDGKLLVLRSTESAEQQEMNAYWRSQARGQVLDPPRPDANASLLMSSATSERSAPSPGSHGQSHAPDPALLDLAQRVDRMKLEAAKVRSKARAVLTRVSWASCFNVHRRKFRSQTSDNMDR